MAVAYASKFAQTSGLNASPTTVALPSGMANGELLLIHCLQVGSTDAETVFNVSGGTMLERAEYDNSSGYHTASLWYKYVNSTDISNGYITVNGSSDYGITARMNLYRVTGSVYSIQSLATNINADATPTYNIGLTPEIGNSLFFIFASGTSGVSGSGYAVATDNPTWTEITDEVITNFGGGTDDPVILAAHATRTASTATGSVSLTFGSSTDSYGILVVIAPVTNATASVTVAEATFSTPTISATGTAVASPAVATLTFTAPTITAVTPTPDWTNQSKSSSDTWTNQSKS